MCVVRPGVMLVMRHISNAPRKSRFAFSLLLISTPFCTHFVIQYLLQKDIFTWLSRYLPLESPVKISQRLRMSDHQDQRPVKQRRTGGRPLFQELESADDDGSSTTSSAASDDMLPVRSQIQHGDAAFAHRQGGRPSDSESSEEEETSSSGSEDTDGESPSEGESNEENEQDEAPSEDPILSTFVTAASPTTNIRSRLQEFLPRLEQANTELDHGEDVQDRRVDEVSGDAEHYIEMDLSLGVLTENADEEGQVILPQVQPSDDEEIGMHVPSAKQTKQTIKRKIEEMDE